MTDNELIAEFMEIRCLYTNGERLWDTSQTGKVIFALHERHLRYDSSWDWLMPVVEKIESMGAHVKIVNNRCTIADNDFTFKPVHIVGHFKIEAVHMTVVEFIKEYNKKS